MIFVDTGAWFAAFVPNDPHHAVAAGWLASNTELLVTTDYIIEKLLTLLKIRNEYQRALRVGEQLVAGAVSRVELVNASEFLDAWMVFKTYSDKGWSFTDCTSLVVIQRLKIQTAFAFDQHFRQFPGVIVVP